MQFDHQFITKVMPKAVVLYTVFPEKYTFSIDTRTINSGDIFIALQGEQIDGHQFVNEAFLKGASGCIIEKKKQSVLDKIDKKILQNKCVFVVENTYEAILNLAKAWRDQLDCPIVAITGSVGKTTTKELIGHILKEHNMLFSSSPANNNTILGVALHLLSVRSEHKVVIQEVGISKPGEMDEIVAILRPTTGVITNIGHQHMDGLGSLSDIAIEKRKLFSLFTERDIGIINGDQVLLSEVSYKHPIVRFGSKTINQIQARKIQISGSHTNFTLNIYKKKYLVSLKQAHEGIIFNMLAASAVAHLLGVPNKVIVAAIEKPIVVEGRFQLCTIKGKKGIIINDTYNANPESMKVALLAFQHIETEAPKIAIIGDMLGLGVNSPFWHRQIGRFLRKVPSLRQLVLVGDFVKWTKKTAPVNLKIQIVADWKEAATYVQTELETHPIILVKGSHNIGLHHLVKNFVIE